MLDLKSTIFELQSSQVKAAAAAAREKRHALELRNVGVAKRAKADEDAERDAIVDAQARLAEKAKVCVDWRGRRLTMSPAHVLRSATTSCSAEVARTVLRVFAVRLGGLALTGGDQTMARWWILIAKRGRAGRAPSASSA